MKNSAVLKRSDRYTHYCPICTACVEDDAAACAECSSEKPDQGWPTIQGCPFPYLGMELDGRYIFRQFLGDGATGYVYRAQALQIYRDFAAKIVDTRRYGKKEFQQELLRRFKMEVEAMSRLHNPHVVAIYEAMELGDDKFVLLMDYVDGRTLQNLLERVGRIKFERAMDIGRQIANGLFEAHRLGFIHRDLKPDNIMIERLPAAGFFARILDFGIVHMMNDGSSTQGFRGTPLYASPEQCIGDPNIDHRADIYGLGCVLFHCLTGQPPFPGTESLRVMDAHVHDDPPLVRDVLPNARNRRGLDDLLQAMLAKDPNDRPQDMSEVIREIDKTLEAQHLAEPTNPEPPAQLVNELQDIKLNGGRFETADFPAASLDEVSSGASQIVHPVIEFLVPEKTRARTYTNVALAASGELALLVEGLSVHVVGMRNDGFAETFASQGQMMITTATLDRTRANVYAADLNGDIWRFTFGRNATKVGTLTDRIYAIACDLNEVVVGTDRGRIVVMDAMSGRTREIASGLSPVSAVAILDKSRRVIATTWDNKVHIVSFIDKAISELKPTKSTAKSVVVSQDETLAATLDEQGNVRFYNLLDTEAVFDLPTSDTNLRSIEFAPDGQLLGLTIEGDTLKLSDFKSRAIAMQVEQSVAYDSSGN